MSRKDDLQRVFDEGLQKNLKNFIIYYENNIRKVKTFQELSKDIQECLGRLDNINSEMPLNHVGILGNISYEWMVSDLACLKGGFKSVALPESCSSSQIRQILQGTKIDLLFLDYSLKEKFKDITDEVLTYYLSTDEKGPENFKLLPLAENLASRRSTILDEYGICFSSGTTENIKRIPLKFIKSAKRNKGFISKLITYLKYRNTFWVRKDNKLIIYMPFSHVQQRSFIYSALIRKIDVVLSDSKNCIKHLIVEKPNIMISVPAIYEVLAQRIISKVNQFTYPKKCLYAIFNNLRINLLNDSNYIKRCFSYFLFQNIKKVYGGRADYFVTGSAPISKNALTTFLKIGVKLYEAYGQSESEIIAMNTTKHYKLGSVGKPLTEVKIDKDSEILLKYDENKHLHTRGALNIKDGFIHTGDLGYIDKEGYLFLTGRKDNVLVLLNGKKVYPEKIEDMLRNYAFIKYCIVASIDNENISLIVNADSSAEQLLKSAIFAINASLADFEKIRNYHLTTEPFTVENGCLTGTLKIKRKIILQRFKNERFSSIELNSVELNSL